MNYIIKDLKKVENSKVVASFSVVLDDGWEIKYCKLFYNEKKNEYYVFFPNFQYKEKYLTYVDCPLNVRNDIRDKVLKMIIKPEITLWFVIQPPKGGFFVL